MKIEYNIPKIKKVISNFYALTKLSISVYDCNYHCLAIPGASEKDENDEPIHVNSSTDNKATSSYCHMIQSSPAFAQLCEIFDKEIFDKVSQTKQPITYTCHAGIVESIHPILYEDNIVGYMIIGKFVDSAHEYSSPDTVIETAQKYGLDYDLLYRAYKKLPELSERQMQAATDILNLCVSYFFQENLIRMQTDILSQKIKDYILNNLSSHLTIEEICKMFYITPNKLYSIFKTEFDTTVKKFILVSRINKAKSLLQHSDSPIPDISTEVGFYDYSYFIRIFKKYTGTSPLKYRKTYCSNTKS